MTHSNLKKAVRARMARTGENYTTVLREVKREREEKQARALAGRQPLKGDG